MSAPLLALEAVTKRYGSTPVLRGVELQVAPGEVVILIGGSGSGKSTLLRVASGLEAADEGAVRLRGETVDAPSQHRFTPPERRRLGMVFQDYALWPHMSARENVEAALTGRGGERRRSAEALLEQLGVGALAARRPAELSGGQQQRVGLARALAATSDLLLLDEPLSSLDVDARERMRALILSAVRGRGAAALFVSHDPTDAWRLADRVAVLERGRIVQVAPPADLYARPATARIARFTDASGPLAATAHAEGGVVWAGDAQAAGGEAPEPGRTLRLYVRPCGVRTGEAGEPARLEGCTFEGGAWRATWRLTAREGALCSLEAVPPPSETRLRLLAEHSFIYADTEDD